MHYTLLSLCILLFFTPVADVDKMDSNELRELVKQLMAKLPPPPRERPASPTVDHKAKWRVGDQWVPQVDIWRRARGLSWEEVEALMQSDWLDADAAYDSGSVAGMPAWAVTYIVAVEIVQARQWADFGEGGGRFSHMEKRIERIDEDEPGVVEHVYPTPHTTKVSIIIYVFGCLACLAPSF
jgi:hypothetical protein